MKYLKQAAIIGTVTFLGEMMHIMLPLPVPASVYGMVLLFLALCTHLIKPEQIQETADWLIAIMPVMFIGPFVGIMEHYTSIADCIIPFCLIVFLTTIIVMAAVGLTVQGIMKVLQSKKGGGHHE